jgi:hypothetical protein
MPPGSKVRLLGAALVLRGLYSVFGAASSFTNVELVVAVLKRLDFWLVTAFAMAAGVTLIWAGFSIASRRPSRRRWVTIFVLFSTLHGAFLVWQNVSPPLPPLIAVNLLFALLSLALFGVALVYLFATRNDPEFKPRLTAPPLERVPAAHAVVTAKIVDGPEWHKALLDSLHGSGVP